MDASVAAAAVAAVVAAVAAVAAWATVALEAGDAAPDATIGRGNRTRQSDVGEAPGGAVGASHNPLAAILSLFSCEDCGAQYLVGQSIPSFSSRGRMRGAADAAAGGNFQFCSLFCSLFYSQF